MKSVQHIINHRILFWLVLALPSYPLLLDFHQDVRYYPDLMYDSGVLSVQLLVLNLCLSPLMIITRRWSLPGNFVRWFFLRRRYIGVACFGYAAIHTLLYIRDTGDLENILWQASNSEIALGWGALLVLLILAATSNDVSARALGKRWKKIHRYVYIATFMIVIHWIQFGFFLQELQVILIPLVILQVYRVWVRFPKSNKS